MILSDYLPAEGAEVVPGPRDSAALAITETKIPTVSYKRWKTHLIIGLVSTQNLNNVVSTSSGRRNVTATSNRRCQVSVCLLGV